MGIFSPPREERYAAAARAIAPYGFVTDAARATQLQPLLPLAELSEPSKCNIAAFGRIEDADVAAFEYTYSSKDSDGKRHWYDRLLIALAHRGIDGRASLRPDEKEWSSAAAFLDAITWVPPFIIVKAFQLINESANPDRTVGNKEFDRLYVVHAASEGDARQSIPPELQDLLPRIGFRGTLELRPGLLLFTVRGTRFNEETLPQALGYVAPLLAATVRRDEYPYR